MAAIDLARLPRIAPTEYRERQRRALAAARERGCEALVAWSRGGSTQDRYADVYYLSGFYSHFPTLHDRAGIWRARGHCACVLAPDGTSELVVDQRRLRDDDAPVADAVVFTADPVEGLVQALRRALPDGGRVALLGGDVLAARWARALGQALPRHELVEADALGHELRLLKSPAELTLLRAAGALGTAAVDAAMAAAVPGAHEGQVVAAAVEQVVGAGGALYGLGLSSGRWAHTFSPTRPAAFDARRTLRAGELLRLDLYGSVDGYLFDFGRSLVVGGGEGSADQRAIVDATIDSVQAGIAAIRPGVAIDEIAKRCDAALLASDYADRFGAGEAPLGSWGHSLGLCWEAPWIERGNELRLQEGMCLAVELRIEAPGVGGANYEDNVIVTADGCELLSAARVRP